MKERERKKKKLFCVGTCAENVLLARKYFLNGRLSVFTRAQHLRFRDRTLLLKLFEDVVLFLSLFIYFFISFLLLLLLLLLGLCDCVGSV